MLRIVISTQAGLPRGIMITIGSTNLNLSVWPIAEDQAVPQALKLYIPAFHRLTEVHDKNQAHASIGPYEFQDDLQELYKRGFLMRKSAQKGQNHRWSAKKARTG